MQRVLSVGYSLAPFKQRNAALAAAGLAVREAIGLVQALNMIENENFDIVVLGSALGSDDRNKIGQAARRRKQNCKLIMLYDGRITGTEIADAIIAADDPQRIIDTIGLLSEDSASNFECA